MWIYDFNSIDIILKKRPKAISQIKLVSGKDSDRIQIIESLAKSNDIQTEWINKDDLVKYLPTTANKNTRMLANISEKPIVDKNILKKLNKESSLILTLDQITDSRNFGAIIRSAVALGVDKIIIQDLKSPPLTPEVYNTSAGTVELIDIISVANISQIMKTLQDQGYWIYGYDLEGKDTIYKTEFSPKSAFVLGSEQLGMRDLVKKSCDFLLNIPMQNDVDSLNVSVSAGIAMYEFTRQQVKI